MADAPGAIKRMSDEMLEQWYTLNAMHNAWIAGLAGGPVDAQQAIALLAFALGTHAAAIIHKFPQHRDVVMRVINGNIECGMQHEFDTIAQEAGSDRTETCQ